MRKGIVIGVVLVSILSVYAISRQTKVSRPCRKVTQACKTAGFKRGHTASERKTFYDQCLKPLMETGSIGDIQIDPEDAVACKHKWSKRNKGLNHKESDDADDA